MRCIGNGLQLVYGRTNLGLDILGSLNFLCRSSGNILRCGTELACDLVGYSDTVTELVGCGALDINRFTDLAEKMIGLVALFLRF